MKLRIKQVLRDRSMTNKKLSELIDRHPVYVTEVINGNKTPSLPLLEKIAEVLQVDIRDLFEAPKKDKTTSDLLQEIRDITNELEDKIKGKEPK